jgi:hypothetical protein
MAMSYLIIRVIHVICGAAWLGSVLFTAWILMPAMGDAGPDAAKVGAMLDKRGIHAFLGIVSGLAVLSGIYLYWHYTAGFSPEISRSHGGMAFGFGGFVAIAALIIGGSIVGRSMKKAAALAQQAAATADQAQRQQLLGQAQALRVRAMGMARVVSILLLITISLMSIALFI